MLQKLIIRNYAIIDHIEINVSGNISVITGETGAGKSIIIGALSLILGQRADSKSLFEQNKKCIVEGVFNIKHNDLSAFFKDNDLDYEEQTIIRREINPAGKSRSFINDTPVNLSVLKSLGSQLVNLHSQHETLALSGSTFQLQLIDAMVQHKEILDDFQKEYTDYNQTKRELDILLENNNSFSDKDYLDFQLNELTEANLIEEELDQLENELSTQENAEEIKSSLFNASAIIHQTDHSINNQLNEVTAILRAIKNYHIDIENLSDRVESCMIDLQDIAGQIDHLEESTVYDPERISELNDRINIINRLLQKHQVKSVKELIEIANQINDKLQSFEQIAEQIENLQSALSKRKQHLIEFSIRLNKNRKKIIPNIESEVKKMLHEVGMPNAQFQIKIEELPFEKINISGLDKITFLFSANKGTHLEELKQVASGGELSRVMLVLKSLVAANTHLPTLIFDEIDTGVSGEVAIKVGRLLEKLGHNHQVICITHLPQIARVGKNHFFVYKEIKENRTVTQIKTLTKDDRVIEIAKMIGGEQYSDTALESAKELVNG